MAYKGLENRLKRIEARTVNKELNIYFIEELKDMYYVSKNFSDDDPLLKLTLPELEKWEKENEDKNTFMIHVSWADEDDTKQNEEKGE